MKEWYPVDIHKQETIKRRGRREWKKRTSGWQRSETWKSPCSPQIHQKYIYMWNNSYITPTERWQKTSDFPKGKKLPMYLGRAKEKRKNRDKSIGTGPAPLGGSCEGGKVSTLRSTFTGGDRDWRQKGSIGATEESTAIGVRRAKWRDFLTEDQCRPAFNSLRGLSAHPLGQVRAGS